MANDRPSVQYCSQQVSTEYRCKVLSDRIFEKTQENVLGEPKTSISSAGGWVNYADLASASGQPISASEARASIKMAPKRKTPFYNTLGPDYGLKIVGKNATTVAVESVACRFALQTEGKSKGT
jgi:hypothetical protein